jgi:hypothetical protein
MNTGSLLMKVGDKEGTITLTMIQNSVPRVVIIPPLFKAEKYVQQHES